jgi:hypothetical protein
MAMADEQNRSLAPGQLVLIHPADTFEDEPRRRHLLCGRIEAVDRQGVRLRPFTSDVDTFQDYDSFVPWASVGLATVVTPGQLPRMRQVLNDSIRRELREAAQTAADREQAVARL